MKEDYRMYLLIKAEMVNVRVDMNIRNGLPRGLADVPNSFLVPMVIATLESMGEDEDHDISILRTACKDLNDVIAGDSYMKEAISYEDFVAHKRDKKLNNLGI